MIDIIVYTKPGCGQCITTKHLLTKLNATFTMIDVTKDPAGEAHVRSLGYQSLPVVVAGDMHWNQFDENKIRAVAAAQHTDNAHLEPAAITYLQQEAA